MNSVHEAPRQTRVVTQVDVLVAGAGPAGVAAALRAARNGASVALVEVQGCLGGIWTAGLLSWILDADNKDGIMAEILGRLEERGQRGQKPDGSYLPSYDPEALKLLLEEMCLEAGIKVRLHTRVVAALSAVGGALSHAITESKSGREAWQAKIFVDATGDGDLASRAGCGFDMGHPETGATQPLSLLALLTGLDAEAVQPFVNTLGGNWGVPHRRLKEAMERGGLSPSYHVPTLFRIYGDLYTLMANHEYGVRCDDAAAISQATFRARAEIYALLEAMRKGDPAFSGVKLVATSAQIGIREGRRIHGLYTVDSQDLLQGARFPDAVCRATFPVDVHATDPTAGKGIEHSPVRAKPYDVPLRALIARDVDNLLLAGRCISGDFLAHASYRVTGNSVAMGEAAGAFAAHCCAQNTTPHRAAACPESLAEFVRQQGLAPGA